MQEIRIGEFIREERLRQGLTQQELCEGICERVTLSRLENGASNPSMSVVNALLEKLEMDGGRFYALLTPQEQQVESLRKEITACNVRYQAAQEADRPAIRADGYGKLHTLEAVMEKGDNINAQFILRSQEILGREDGSPYTLQERLELLTRAVRLTVPRFDLEQVEKGRYTLTEMKILIQIALAYSSSGQRGKAVELYRKYLDYIQGRNQNTDEARKMTILIAHNYALELRLLERYREAAEIGELGRRTCQEYGHYQLLGGLLHNLGECYHFLGNDEKSLDCFFEAYYLYKAAGDQQGVALLQADAKACFPEMSGLAAGLRSFFGQRFQWPGARE